MKYARRDFLKQSAAFTLAAASGPDLGVAQVKTKHSELADYDALGLAYELEAARQWAKRRPAVFAVLNVS